MNPEAGKTERFQLGSIGGNSFEILHTDNCVLNLFIGGNSFEDNCVLKLFIGGNSFEILHTNNCVLNLSCVKSP